MSTKDNAYIKLLRESYHVNIYTLMAADTIKQDTQKQSPESISKSKTNGFDIQNPIDWAKVKDKMYSGRLR